MAANIAVVGASDAESPFYRDVAVFSLTVGEPGSYVVLARMVVENRDITASQNCRFSLVHSGSAIDWVDLRIPNGLQCQLAVTLQGTLDVGTAAPEVVEMRCEGAGGGFASRPWISAIQVDSIADG